MFFGFFGGRNLKKHLPIEDISNSKIEELINEWVHNAKDRNMLKRRLIDGVTYEDLAEEFEMSDSQVWNRIDKAKAQLFKHI